MKLYYLGCMALSIPPAYAMEGSKLEEKNYSTVPSLQEISLHYVARHIEKYTTQNLACLNEDLLSQLLEHQHVASNLPAITLYTPEKNIQFTTLVQIKSWYRMKLYTGEQLHLRRLNDRYPIDNHTDFFYVQGSKDKKYTHKFGLNNLHNITCVAPHPAQTSFAVGREDGSVTLYNLINRDNYIEHHFYSGQVCMITYNMDSSCLIAISEDNKIVVWNLQKPYAAVYFPNIYLNTHRLKEFYVKRKAYMFEPVITFKFEKYLHKLNFFYNDLTIAQKIALIRFVGIKKLARLLIRQQNIMQTESFLCDILDPYRQYLIDANFEQPVEDTLLKCTDELSVEVSDLSYI